MRSPCCERNRRLPGRARRERLGYGRLSRRGSPAHRSETAWQRGQELQLLIVELFELSMRVQRQASAIASRNQQFNNATTQQLPLAPPPRTAPCRLPQLRRGSHHRLTPPPLPLSSAASMASRRTRRRPFLVVRRLFVGAVVVAIILAGAARCVPLPGDHQRPAADRRGGAVPAAGHHPDPRRRRHGDRRVLLAEALPGAVRPHPAARAAGLHRRRGRRLLPPQRHRRHRHRARHGQQRASPAARCRAAARSRSRW